ncbi:MAG: flagellar motor switch phosphatase FliY [Spirochaetales bacterium]|nr:flagellar motor switch phosphatase FliY [Spirochaetales bacterium]
MSDGSLSQDEIDALLMGDVPTEIPTAGGNDAGFGDAEKSAVLGLLGEITGAQGSTLSGIMVKSVVVGAPQLDVLGREAFLSSLPDEVVEIKIDFKSGLAGAHGYVLKGEDALKIAAPMMGQDDLELDGTAISAVSEAMSQIVGASVTALGDKVGETILTEAPEGQNVPKAMLALPGDDFARVTYPLEIEGQGNLELVELFSLDILNSLASRLGASTPASPVMDIPASPQPMMGGDFGGAAMAPPINNGGMQQMMAPPQGGQPMGGMMGGFGGQAAPNVQGIQLPELSPTISAGEQRNIGLLMDVSMELTVELGRTKRKIKDILGMGEGTIIELDKLAGEPVDILVNNNLIARGEVVVIDENFGVRVTEIVSTMDRMAER